MLIGVIASARALPVILSMAFRTWAIPRRTPAIIASRIATIAIARMPVISALRTASAIIARLRISVSGLIGAMLSRDSPAHAIFLITVQRTSMASFEFVVFVVKADWPLRWLDVLHNAAIENSLWRLLCATVVNHAQNGSV